MKKKLIISLAVVLLLVGIGFAYRHFFGNVTDKTPTSKPVNTVNYGAQTSQEKAETKRFKEAQQKAQNPPPTPETSDGRTKVIPFINYGGYSDGLVEVSAFVPGIFEDGGTCTLKLTNGDIIISRTTMGVSDATTTRCPLFSIPGKDVNPKGSWTAVVSYSSSKSLGSSESMRFEVK